MPKDVQVKLLRVLQEGELRPVGSATAGACRCARDLGNQSQPERTSEHLLREDFYFRIATVVLQVPPLAHAPGGYSGADPAFCGAPFAPV